MIVEGRIMGFLILLFSTAVALYVMSIKDRWNPINRILSGVEAIPELIGRCIELDRPIHFTTGYGGSLSASEVGPQIMAGLSVFNHVARICARMNAKLIVSVGQTDTIPILEEILREAYLEERQPLPDIEETLRFHSRNQFAWVSAVSGLMYRDRPAANIVVGPIWAESSQLVCSAAQVGALQLVGTARTSHIPFFALLSDYVLLGEEIYAAGATLGGDKETLNSLASQDIMKLFSIALIILGVILGAFGNNLVKTLLGM